MPFLQDLRLSTKLVGFTLLVFLLSFASLTRLEVEGAKDAVLQQGKAQLEALRTSRGHIL